MDNSKKVEEFVEELSQKLGAATDFFVRYVNCANRVVAICYLKDIVRHELIADGIIRPLVLAKSFSGLDDYRKNISFSSSCIKKEKQEAITYLLIGYTIMISDEDDILVFDTTLFPKRQPDEPPTSAVLKGPRNGFVDDINSNMASLRKNLKTDKFHFKEYFVGEYTQTKVTVCYLYNLVDKNILDKICTKIQNIKINGVIDSYYISNELAESKQSLFAQIGTCEKPDIAASRMLEGRVVILVDNSPIALTLPYVIVEDMQNSNDYYQNYIFSSFIRFVRLFGIFLAAIMPSGYLALRLYHYKLIPFKFLVTISNSTQGLPFTPFVELMFILIMFELLYEVSLRLPQYLGLATSIVGALILGETGVSAGLISPPAVMIVALSIISIYTMPDQRGQLSILRLIFVLLGAMFGLVGIILGILILISELAKINSYGSAYLSPFAPFNKNDFSDSIIKRSSNNNKKMPQSFANKKNK